MVGEKEDEDEVNFTDSHLDAQSLRFSVRKLKKKKSKSIIEHSSRNSKVRKQSISKIKNLSTRSRNRSSYRNFGSDMSVKDRLRSISRGPLTRAVSPKGSFHNQSQSK